MLDSGGQVGRWGCAVQWHRSATVRGCLGSSRTRNHRGQRRSEEGTEVRNQRSKVRGQRQRITNPFYLPLTSVPSSALLCPLCPLGPAPRRPLLMASTGSGHPGRLGDRSLSVAVRMALRCTSTPFKVTTSGGKASHAVAEDRSRRATRWPKTAGIAVKRRRRNGF